MIREPAVAGTFYPGSAQKLKDVIRKSVTLSEAKLAAKAIVAPHAGYVYSGAVAGKVYGAIELPHRFLILGPNHTGVGAPLSLYPDGQWRTPLGLVSIDAELTSALRKEIPSLRDDRMAHTREHSLEVQIPFLQELVPDFIFAAICVGTLELKALEDLGHGMARALNSVDDPVLIISSSDMNHYEAASVSAVKDRLAIDCVLAVDPQNLYHIVRERDISMCGIAPTVAALTACRDLGATRGSLIQYSNSGEVSGDYDHVVGYAGMAIC